jgi:hypothetical protein
LSACCDSGHVGPLNARLSSLVSRLRDSPRWELAGNFEFRTSAAILVDACPVSYTAFEYEDRVFAWRFPVDLSPNGFRGGFITGIALDRAAEGD